MRTSPPTDLEIAAFTKFARDYDIIDHDEVGVQNANILCTPIIDADGEITPQTLAASLLNVKNQIQFKSVTYKKAEALSSKLNPEEVAAYHAWANHQSQKLLILDHSEEGYQNLAVLLGWLAGNQVSGHSLDLALGNCIHNSKARIHFRPQPKQQDRSIVQGKPNHAFGQTEEPKKAAVAGVQGQEFVNGRRNHSYVKPEDAAKKVSVAAPDAWQEIISLQMKEWTLPSQQVRLENELSAGLAAGRSSRDISTSLAAIIRDQQRGR
jgi:hypothetical protein